VWDDRADHNGGYWPLLPDDAPVSIPTLARELGVDRRTVDSECQPCQSLSKMAADMTTA